MAITIFSVPSFSPRTLTFLSTRGGVYSPALIYELALVTGFWWLDRGGYNAVRLSRLSHKRWYSFHPVSSLLGCLPSEPNRHALRKSVEWSHGDAWVPSSQPAPAPRHVSEGTFRWFQPTPSSLPAEDPDIMDQGQVIPMGFCLILDPQN